MCLPSVCFQASECLRPILFSAVPTETFPLADAVAIQYQSVTNASKHRLRHNLMRMRVLIVAGVSHSASHGVFPTQTPAIQAKLVMIETPKRSEELIWVGSVVASSRQQAGAVYKREDVNDLIFWREGSYAPSASVAARPPKPCAMALLNNYNTRGNSTTSCH
jgi:hypothetical protein